MQVAEKHQGGRMRPRGGGRGWLGALAAPAILLAITVGFYWKLVLTDQYTWLESPDLANQVLPWFQYQAGEWHQGRFPMWDPHHGTGQSLIGQGQPGAAYPPNWILFSLPLRNGWIRQLYLHWYFVLTRFLAALFMYWLCRDLKRSRPASLLASAVFSLGGYIGFTDWPQMVNGAIWTPLVFLFLLRALRGRSPMASAALAGMFLGVAWLSGHHQVPIFVTLLVSGIWAWQALRGLRLHWPVVRAASLFYVFAALTSALQTLPAYEYGRLALRWVGLSEPVGWRDRVPYNIHTSFSLEPTYLLGLIFPGAQHHGEIVVGVLAVALTATALVVSLRNPVVRLLTLVGAAGLALALGAGSVVHGLLYAVLPLVEKARVPFAATVILHFSIACLSAYGIDRLCSRIKFSRPRRLSCWLLAASLLLWALVAAVWMAKDRAVSHQVAFPALVCLLAAGVFWARSRGRLSRTGTVAACLFLAVFELGYARSDSFPHRLDADRDQYLRKMAQAADILRFVSRHPWPVRIDIEHRVLGFNFGDWHGLDVLATATASLPANFVSMGTERERVRMLLGVNYELGDKPSHPSQELVFTGADGVSVYQNRAAFPRVWAVHELERLETEGQGRDRLGEPGFDLAHKGFVVGGPFPALEPAAGADSVRLQRREPHWVRIEAEMRSKGLVVLSDAYYPGWKATVDGQPATIYEVYGGLRGVVTPAGRHVIEMRYRPLTVILGGILSALGVLGACGLALAGRRRRRPIG